MTYLLLILVFPIFVSIIINSFKDKQQIVKYLPILSSFMTFFIISIFTYFSRSNEYGDSITLYSLFPSLGISMSFISTNISIALLFLSNITITTALFSTLKTEKRLNEINTLILLISVGIYWLILSDDLFVFFLFYEIAVVPMFLMIMNWGYNLEREVSGPFSKVLNYLAVGTKNYGAYKITMYLLFGSLLIFFGLAVIGISEGTFSISSIVSSKEIFSSNNLFAFFLLFIGFGSHSALWPFHTWVPDGHGTAPTAGSIIFAGILMKIGIIGFIKIIIPILSLAFTEYTSLLIILASINIIYGAFTAMMQDDLKYLAAYASLSHIGYIFLALAMNSHLGMVGAITQTISHGLIICLLFYSVGIIHRIKKTRSIKELSSMVDDSPNLGYVFIFAAFASIGFPLTSGFVAEFLIMLSVYHSNQYLLLIVPIFGIFITTIYMFRTVKKICLRFVDSNNIKRDLEIDDKTICYILVILICLIGIFPSFVTSFIQAEPYYIIREVSIWSQ